MNKKRARPDEEITAAIRAACPPETMPTVKRDGHLILVVDGGLCALPPGVQYLRRHAALVNAVEADEEDGGDAYLVTIRALTLDDAFDVEFEWESAPALDSVPLGRRYHVELDYVYDCESVVFEDADYPWEVAQ